MRTAVETINKMADDHGYTGDEARTVVDALDDLSTVLDGGGGGGGGGVLALVNADESGNTVVCDKTAGEIISALHGKQPVVFFMFDSQSDAADAYWLKSYYEDGDTHHFDFDTFDLTTDSLDGYPSTGNGE